MSLINEALKRAEQERRRRNLTDPSPSSGPEPGPEPPPGSYATGPPDHTPDEPPDEAPERRPSGLRAALILSAFALVAIAIVTWVSLSTSAPPRIPAEGHAAPPEPAGDPTANTVSLVLAEAPAPPPEPPAAPPPHV
ncbi:MAG: hypothetical protein ACYS5V_15795, partial [Planctomycetota bacterium]